MGQALRNPRYFTVEEYLAHERASQALLTVDDIYLGIDFSS